MRIVEKDPGRGMGGQADRQTGCLRHPSGCLPHPTPAPPLCFHTAAAGASSQTPAGAECALPYSCRQPVSAPTANIPAMPLPRLDECLFFSYRPCVCRSKSTRSSRIIRDQSRRVVVVACLRPRIIPRQPNMRFRVRFVGVVCSPSSNIELGERTSPFRQRVRRKLGRVS